jgi:uncharacterized protein (TIGR02996 family)
VSERKAFEDAIRADPYDRMTRLVFADWLDENDCPEEADWQRSWTLRRQEAEEWLANFAGDIGGGQVTLEEVVEAGHAYVKDGSGTTLAGLGFDEED